MLPYLSIYREKPRDYRKDVKKIIRILLAGGAKEGGCFFLNVIFYRPNMVPFFYGYSDKLSSV